MTATAEKNDLTQLKKDIEEMISLLKKMNTEDRGRLIDIGTGMQVVSNLHKAG